MVPDYLPVLSDKSTIRKIPEYLPVGIKWYTGSAPLVYLGQASVPPVIYVGLDMQSIIVVISRYYFASNKAMVIMPTITLMPTTHQEAEDCKDAGKGVQNQA